MILIAGAGLTGLSAAYHLDDKDYMIVEKESEIGGLCRTKKIGDFHFDYTGHLLHINNPIFSQFISQECPNLFSRHVRKSFIHTQGTYVPYPFQINTFGLPSDTIFDCVYGFIKARMRNEKENSSLDKQDVGKSEWSFKEWILRAFGEGFAQHFFIPFNEKLYCRDLDEISSEWTSWSIPVPALEDVLGGAIGIKKTKIGYNQTFLYPKRGGIEILPKKLASLCRNVLLEKEIVSVDLKRKEVYLEDGGVIKYHFLISTVPLNRLLSISKDLPDEVSQWGQNLKYIKVIDWNIAFRGSFRDDIHWIYFPEKVFPFYRVGFSTNFSKGIAPEGYSCLYAEVAVDGKKEIHNDKIKEQVMEQLIKLGIIQNEKDIVIQDLNIIDPAYVVFDRFRKRNLLKIRSFFEEHGVFLAGRFGGWDYLSMEKAFLDGREVAQRILEAKQVV